MYPYFIFEYVDIPIHKIAEIRKQHRQIKAESRI